VATINFKTVEHRTKLCAGAVIALGAIVPFRFFGRGAGRAPQGSPGSGALPSSAYKGGDHEEAARYFALAQMGSNYLTTPDQQDLATFGAQNELALKNRKGRRRNRSRFAEQALLKGQMQEAAGFVKCAQRESEPDPKRIAISWRSSTARCRLKPRPLPRIRAKPMRSRCSPRARALQAGDPRSMPENLAMQAEKASSGISVWMQPWSDFAGQAAPRYSIRQGQTAAALDGQE